MTIDGLHETQPKRITYPSGLVVFRHELHNAAKTIRIQIERIVSGVNRAWCDGSIRVGSWSVDGSMLVCGESFESLPSRDFRIGSAATTYARGMYKKFEPMTREAVTV